MFLLDCFYGSIARQCEKQTVFGLYFDTISDFTKMFILGVILLLNKKTKNYNILSIILIIIIFMDIIQGVLYLKFKYDNENNYLKHFFNSN